MVHALNKIILIAVAVCLYSVVSPANASERSLRISEACEVTAVLVAAFRGKSHSSDTCRKLVSVSVARDCNDDYRSRGYTKAEAIARCSSNHRNAVVNAWSR